MTALLAGFPILVLLLLMLGRGWSAAWAGGVGLAVALGVALAAFGFPRALDPNLTLDRALAGTGAEAGFTALTILWIIGPALGIHHLQMGTGAAEVLRAALAAFAPDPRILALLVAWFFVLFMEGAAGFGSSVALAAPFLVAAGFRPVEAVTITLTGHIVGVSFGAVGTPVVPQVAATGLGPVEIARATGIYHSLLGWLPLGAVILFVTRSRPDQGGGLRIWRWTTAAFLCFLAPYTLLWYFVGPELPTIGGALFGGVAFIGLLQLFGRREGDGGGEGSPSVSPAPATVLRAAAPYLVLVALVMVTRLVPGFRNGLQNLAFEWELHGVFSGSIQPFYHPGTMLLVGFIVGALLQGAGARTTVRAVRDATLRLIPVAAALLAMLGLSRVMVHAGMTEALALQAAEAAAGAWPLPAAFVGLLGTFVTGSATASNILFTDLHRDTALATGLPVAGVVGVQGFGAAAGNMVCPHNVVAAGATVGLAGREGEILRQTLWPALFYAGAGGLLALWLVR